MTNLGPGDLKFIRTESERLAQDLTGKGVVPEAISLFPQERFLLESLHGFFYSLAATEPSQVPGRYNAVSTLRAANRPILLRIIQDVEADQLLLHLVAEQELECCYAFLFIDGLERELLTDRLGQVRVPLHRLFFDQPSLAARVAPATVLHRCELQGLKRAELGNPIFCHREKFRNLQIGKVQEAEQSFDLEVLLPEEDKEHWQRVVLTTPQGQSLIAVPRMGHTLFSHLPPATGTWELRIYE
ncbi:MAG: hypothetical protein HY652_01870 [Acidobacteria bacterium]|nr:hypothetical protein [Acidobacteriota bacterium]